MFFPFLFIYFYLTSNFPLDFYKKFVADVFFLWVANNVITLWLWVARIWFVDYDKGFQGLEISTRTSYFIFMLYNFYYLCFTYSICLSLTF